MQTHLLQQLQEKSSSIPHLPMLRTTSTDRGIYNSDGGDHARKRTTTNGSMTSLLDQRERRSGTATPIATLTFPLPSPEAVSMGLNSKTTKPPRRRSSSNVSTSSNREHSRAPTATSMVSTTSTTTSAAINRYAKLKPIHPTMESSPNLNVLGIKPVERSLRSALSAIGKSTPSLSSNTSSKPRKMSTSSRNPATTMTRSGSVASVASAVTNNTGRESAYRHQFQHENLIESFDVQITLDSSSASSASSLFPNTIEYEPIPLQQEIYSRVHPDDHHKQSENFFITQGYLLNTYFHQPQLQLSVELLGKAINTIVGEYRVLRTRFYRNERILDADVQAFVDKTAVESLSPFAYLELINPAQDPILSQKTHLDTETLTQFTRRWIQGMNKLERPFSILLIQNNNANVMIVIASNAVADEVTLSWISRQVLDHYKALSNMDNCEYESKEGLADFVDFTNDAISNGRHQSRSANIYFKDVVFERVQDGIVTDAERDKIESQLRKLNIDRTNVRTQRDTLVKNHAQYTNELARLKSERKRLEIEQNSGKTITFYDSLSNEYIEISPKAHEILVKVVLGADADSHCVDGLLKRHNFEAEVLEKLNSTTMSLEDFAQLDEITLSSKNILPKIKKRLLALSEYVRNRLRECIQEQTKLKFVLERSIAKYTRELDAMTDNLAKATNQLDNVEDAMLRLNYILKPPYIETRVKPLSLEGSMSASDVNATKAKDYNSLYGWIPINMDEDIIQNLRSFHHAFRLRQKRRNSKATDNNNNNINNNNIVSDDSANSDLDDLLLSTTAMIKPVDAACLAGFAILMTHITGNNKFLLGCKTNSRTKGVVAGPLSDTLPAQFDFTDKKTTTFSQVYGKTLKQLRKMKKFKMATSWLTVAHQNDITPEEFPVQFEFIPKAEAEKWDQLGLSLGDLCLEGNAHRLWSTAEHDKYDMKLVLIEDGKNNDSLYGGFRYRKDKFDEDKMIKWIEKYETLLRNIENTQRKILISGMISRLYNSIWTSSPSLVDNSKLSSVQSLSSSAGDSLWSLSEEK